MQVAGESWPLTRERMRYETQALLKYNELAPGLVPVVYDFDEEMYEFILGSETTKVLTHSRVPVLVVR